MTQPDTLERYLDDFGSRLSTSAAAPPPRHRRPLALGLAGTVVAAAVVAIVLTGSGESLDPVAEARAALAPPGEIVYMKVTTEMLGADTGPPPSTTEQWSAQNPPRWRSVQTLPDTPGGGGSYDRHGRIVGRQEISYGGGEQRMYVAERDTLDVTQGFSDDDPVSTVPSLLPSSGDPNADLRTMLQDGAVTDEGEVQAGGRTVRRFAAVQRNEDGDVVRRLAYDADPDTFAPISGELTVHIGDPGGGVRDTFRLRIQVDAYKRIPLDAASAKLLAIQTTPQTKVSITTAEEMRMARERTRQWRSKCRAASNGVMKCPPPDVPPPKLP
jgi:hypothetical protein